MFKISLLPYNFTALEPYISRQTMDLHYSKHHQAYVNKLNELIDKTEMEKKSLEEIIRLSHNNIEYSSIFNNAGQHYNHELFWSSLSPLADDREVPELLLKMINRDFISMDGLLAAFKREAAAQFGSGWVWLVLEGDSLAVKKTGNAEPIFLQNLKPLLALDVWEHSYYLDYQNMRLNFVEAVFNNLFNWKFAAGQVGI